MGSVGGRACILGAAFVLLACGAMDATDVDSRETIGAIVLDSEGRRWEAVRRVEVYDESPVTPPDSSEDPSSEVDIASVSLDEATRMLRPIGEFEGVEYTLADEDARELARMIQEVARETRTKRG